MKIEQLVQAIEIAGTKSITKASENLYMSQSNLSSSIKALEKELNNTIFVRSNNGTLLTEFGEKFIYQAKPLVDQFNYIQKMSSNNGKSVNKFSISSYYFLFVNYVFSEIFNKYKDQDIFFNLRDACGSIITDNIKNKESEIGILSIPSYNKSLWLKLFETNGIEYHRLTEETPVVLVSSNNNSFESNIDAVSISMLEDHTMITYTEENPVFKQNEMEMCQKLSPKNIISVSDRGSLISILKYTSSYHIASHNYNAYKLYDFHNEIRAIPMDIGDFKIEIGWIKLKNSCLSPIGKEFLLMLQETLILENQLAWDAFSFNV